jgi:hypothetical protein
MDRASHVSGQQQQHRLCCYETDANSFCSPGLLTILVDRVYRRVYHRLVYTVGAAVQTELLVLRVAEVALVF